MNNLLHLISINLKTSFNLDKVFSSKNNQELRKNIFMTLLIIAFVIYFGFYIYDFSNTLMNGFVLLGSPHLLLGLFFCLISSMLLFTNVYKVNGTIFNSKDNDLLMSLPIKKSTIITSKFLTLYISSLFYVMLFMIPSFITYIQNVNVDFMFYVLYIITLFIIPFVPIIIATMIGTLITGASSKFRFKNLANYAFTFVFVAIVFFLSYKMNNMSNIDLSNAGKSIIDIINRVYPLTNIYIDIIKEYNILSLLVFIVLPCALFYMFIKVIEKFYLKINNNLTRTYSNKNFKIKMEYSSPLIGLYKKEVKRYFSSVNYVLNTSIGGILLTICIILFVTSGSDKIDSLIGIEGLSQMFSKSGPILFGAFCALTCTTHSSISLEGKNLWIIKSLPITPMEIYLSKIMVNLTIIVPVVIINSIILCVYLKSSLLTFAFMIITPLAYGIFISLVGLILNLSFPIFNWKYEIKVIKQSLPSFLSIIIGILFAVVPLTVDYTINNNLYIFIITFAIIIMDYVLYLYLKNIETKKFIKLGN